MSPPFRINHLSGQRVRISGNRHGEIVSVLYDRSGDLIALKVRLDSTGQVIRYPVTACYVMLPPLAMS
jgi:hypothetical protein